MMFREWLFRPLKVSIHHLRSHIMATEAELVDKLNNVTASLKANAAAKDKKISDLIQANAALEAELAAHQASASDDLTAAVQNIADEVDKEAVA